MTGYPDGFLSDRPTQTGEALCDEIFYDPDGALIRALDNPSCAINQELSNDEYKVITVTLGSQGSTRNHDITLSQRFYSEDDGSANSNAFSPSIRAPITLNRPSERLQVDIDVNTFATVADIGGQTNCGQALVFDWTETENLCTFTTLEIRVD